MNTTYMELLNSIEMSTNTYAIKQNNAPVFLQALYKGNFISILLKGKTEPITNDELLDLRQTIKAGGKCFVAFEDTKWEQIQLELDGRANNHSWTQIPSERYLSENYTKKFSSELERDNGYLSLVKMPLVKEEELFGRVNYLSKGVLPM